MQKQCIHRASGFFTPYLVVRSTKDLVTIVILLVLTVYYFRLFY